MKCPVHCTRRRHGALRRQRIPLVEREGTVARIYCPQCEARIAGTFAEEQVAEILTAHFHQERSWPVRRQMEIAT